MSELSFIDLIIRLAMEQLVRDDWALAAAILFAILLRLWLSKTMR